MKKLAMILIPVMISGLAAPAMADVDYRCLHNCVSVQGSSGSCMKQCSYNIDMTPTAIAKLRKKIEKEPHNQFSKQFVSTGIVLNPTRTTQPSAEKNYQCVSECQKEGMQYQFCQAACVSR